MAIDWHLTPKHQKLSPTKAKRELKDLDITIDELPLIKYSDAAIQKLVDDGETIKVDDIIKINRISKTGGEVPYYRKVIY